MNSRVPEAVTLLRSSRGARFGSDRLNYNHSKNLQYGSDGRQTADNHFVYLGNLSCARVKEVTT